MRHHHLSSLVPTLAMLCALGACIESTSYTPEPPSVPAPRLPMNNAYVGSVHTGPLRPLFRWEPATAKASGMISYQLQLSPDSKFETDVTSIETAETSYQPEADLPVSLAPPVGARYFWRLRSCLRGACSEYSRPWYVNLGRVIKDYNGDGYSDLAVGASGSDSFYTDAGRVLVYLGGPVGLVDGRPDVLLGGYDELRTGGNEGRTVQSAGDVNGDGFADLIWSMLGTDSSPIGHAYLFLGGTVGAFDGVTDTIFSDGIEQIGFGIAAGPLGDVNGDGFGDLYVISTGSNSRTEIFLGNAGMRINARADAVLPYGTSVAAAGDVNGDGLADVAIGNMADSTGGESAGAAYLYTGSVGEGVDSKRAAMLVGRGYHDMFGAEVAGVGDVNGDGLSDFAVGNLRNSDTGGGKSGSVELFLGGTTFEGLLSETLMGSLPNDSFGTHIAGVEDVNGDGLSDLLIGAAEARPGGRAYLYMGAAGFPRALAPDATFVGATGNNLGGAVAAAGDVNGDGFADLAIGAYGHASYAGRVDVFLGGAGSSFDSVADSTFLGTPNDYFGIGLASASLVDTRCSICQGDLVLRSNHGRSNSARQTQIPAAVRALSASSSLASWASSSAAAWAPTFREAGAASAARLAP
jgi:hypothetical protein